MSSKLIPANPAEVMVIRDITPNVTTLSVPFVRYGLIEFGGRCTITRMTDGGVMVFSPVALTPAAAAVVDRLGDGKGVRYLVAPDMEHHIFLSEWARAYPGARIVAPAGLAAKRAATAGRDPKIEVDDVFFAELADNAAAPTQAIAPDFDADFATVYVDTHPNKEIVLLYRRDRVLIEADLLMNLPATEQYARVPAAARRGGDPAHPNLVHRLAWYFMWPRGSFVGVRRFQWHFASKSNRPRFDAAIETIASWPFDALIPCHGDVVETGGKTLFRNVFAWHLADKKST